MENIIIPEYKNDLIKLVESHNYNFGIKISMGDTGFVVGMKIKDSPYSNYFPIVTFFNSFENTKNNALKIINDYLELNGENILPKDDSFINDMFNPYKSNDLNYPLENLTFRIESLWDQLAHIANLQYNLQINVKKVGGSIFKNRSLEEKNNYPLLEKIDNYFKDNESFAGLNCHDFCSDFRNVLIHYCDFNSMRFINDYIKTNENINFYPRGFYFGALILDMLKAIEFAKVLYDEFINKIEL